MKAMENFRGSLFQEISHINKLYIQSISDPFFKVFLPYFFWSKSPMAHCCQLILLKASHGKFSWEIISRNFPPEQTLDSKHFRSIFKVFLPNFFCSKSPMAHCCQLILLKASHGKFSWEIISRNFPPEQTLDSNYF